MTDINVQSIVRDWLVANGYDALALTDDWDGCGCGIDYLFPCDGPCNRCQPAHRITWEECVERFQEEGDQCPNGLTEAECDGCYAVGRKAIDD